MMQTTEQRKESLTFTYKVVEYHPILFDIYHPRLSSGSHEMITVSAVVYFHGGGLTVGNRKSWFPLWLKGA